MPMSASQDNQNDSGFGIITASRATNVNNSSSQTGEEDHFAADANDKQVSKIRNLNRRNTSSDSNRSTEKYWDQRTTIHNKNKQQQLNSAVVVTSVKAKISPMDSTMSPVNVIEGGQQIATQPPPKSKQLEGRTQNSDSAAAKCILATEVVIIFFYIIFVNYGEDAAPDTVSTGGRPNNAEVSLDNLKTNSITTYYAMFQDVHVMIFVGFGFLMTFLKKYGYSAVGYNLMLAALAIQWSVLCRGLLYNKGPIPLDITSLIQGDFAAGAVLISFGAVLGTTTPLQLLVMCLIEVFLYAVNEYIGADIFKAIDIGGSMFIHTFGAYFGLAVSLALRKHTDNEKEEANYVSDIFAMIGTVFLWMFWPSFNAAMATGDDQHRAVLNTVLSLTGSCLFSYAMSSFLSPGKKFNMVHIQNATLAGGVAVGASADLMIRPFGALIIGSGAGVLSTLGYVYITPFLIRIMGLHDTCGVHNLHGMPGVLAGLIGSLMAATATEADYGKSLYSQYPARAPIGGDGESGLGRTAGEQAMYQLAALGVTILIAAVGGALTGLLLRLPVFAKVHPDNAFDDTHLWSVPEEEENHSHHDDDHSFHEQDVEKQYKDSVM